MESKTLHVRALALYALLQCMHILFSSIVYCIINSEIHFSKTSLVESKAIPRTIGVTWPDLVMMSYCLHLPTPVQMAPPCSDPITSITVDMFQNIIKLLCRASYSTVMMGWWQLFAKFSPSWQRPERCTQLTKYIFVYTLTAMAIIVHRHWNL